MREPIGEVVPVLNANVQSAYATRTIYESTRADVATKMMVLGVSSPRVGELAPLGSIILNKLLGEITCLLVCNRRSDIE